MEESKRNQVKIKMRGGGIGIRAVVLLGGALATAALASAFVVGKNWRSSGKIRRHRSRPPEINKQREPDQADKAQQFVFLDHPSHVNNNNPSSEVIKEIESSANDTAFLVSNQSSTLSCLEIIEEIPKESQNLEQVHIEEERAGSEAIDDGEIYKERRSPVEISEKQPKQEENNEACYDDDQEEIIKVILVDYAFEEVRIDQKKVEKNVNLKEDMEKRELEEEGINDNVEMFFSDESTEVMNKNCENVEVTKDRENDLERDMEKKEVAAESTELMNKNKTSLEEIEHSTAKDGDSITEMSEDEENLENITKDFDDETILCDQEVEGKIQEDIFPTVADTDHSSRFCDEKDNLDKTFINKYVAELATLKNDHLLTNSTNSRRITIATLVSVLSSLSCSLFFGLSFVKLCVIVFLTMVLSSAVTDDSN